MKSILLTQDEVAIVDDRFYEALNQHRWYCHPSGAARGVRPGVGRTSTILMHHEVLKLAGVDLGHRVGFKNGDRLDCRLDNLKPAKLFRRY